MQIYEFEIILRRGSEWVMGTGSLTHSVLWKFCEQDRSGLIENAVKGILFLKVVRTWIRKQC